MSSKSRSSATEGSNNKASSSPATPRASKLGSRVGIFKSDADSLSPQQKPRLSVDLSIRSVTSKPAFSRPTKLATTPDKQPTRVVKGPELQAQLTAIHEDLKKANEKLALSEKEKAKALEANDKLREALAAQKRAEEDSKIEEFQALEIEQVTTETDQMKGEKWKKVLESVRQHALDLSALLSTIEELERVKQELAITTDTKNQALTHADDATKIAEIHAEKIETLSAELARVKASNRKLELVKTKIFEDCIEELNVELEAAKMVESYNRNLAEEWMKKADSLEIGLEAVSKMRDEIEESEHRLEMAKGEAADMAKKVEFLVLEIEMVKEKNIQALNNEKIAADSFQNLLVEKNKLAKEMENLSNENKKNKVFMESLASALHEMSTEARETKDKLLSSQDVNKNYESEIENLNFTLKSSSEKHEEEIDILNKSIEFLKNEYRSSKEEWEKKELNFMTLLKEKEEKAFSMANKLIKAENEIVCLNEALGKAEGESLKSKENLMSKENEIQSIIHEKEELSKLLEESMVKTKNDENGEISDSEKDYAYLSDDEGQSGTPTFGNLNGKNEDKKENDAILVGNRMAESCKIEENDERSVGRESFEDEEDPKIHVNGGTSPLEQLSQKKTKPLLKKFGSLLKKKGVNSQK